MMQVLQCCAPEDCWEGRGCGVGGAAGGHVEDAARNRVDGAGGQRDGRAVGRRRPGRGVMRKNLAVTPDAGTDSTCD